MERKKRKKKEVKVQKHFYARSKSFSFENKRVDSFDLRVDPNKHFNSSDLGQLIFFYEYKGLTYIDIFLSGSPGLSSPSPILPYLVETHK